MGKVRCINCMKMIDEETAFCPHCGYGQKGEQSPFGVKPGTILRGRYLVGRMLGQGGFGITYVGYDLTLDLRVAIKEYFPSGSVTRNSTVSNRVQWNTAQMGGEQWRAGCEGFLTEARRMAKTDSLPGIVRVRDTFPENQTAYIVMDYIEGRTLKQKLQETGPMGAGECLGLLRPLMGSLETMHSQGLIHRDISPDNIMVQPDGSACLLDFGAAKDISFQQTAASRQVAKEGFSPPEQYREKGSIGPWTDVYALCATIYYCTTGKLVPDAMERLYEDTLDLEALLPGDPGMAVINALRDGLKLRPEERIRTVGELLGRLEGTGTSGDRKDPEICGDGREPEVGGTDRDREADPGKILLEDRAPREKQEEPQGGSTDQPEDVESENSEKTQGSTVKGQIVQDSGTGRWKKKIGKKTAVVAAAVVAVVLLLFGHGRKDTTRETAVPSQTGEELPTDTGQSQGAADDAGKIEMAPADREEVKEVSNILMGDDSCEYSEDDDKYYGTVLGSEITRDRIVAVQFVDTLDGMTDGAWDVSAGQDGTVMAWTKPDATDGQMLDLVIGAEGKVRAEDCSGLFQGYSNVEKIDFSDCFDTSRVTDMGSMFRGCKNLTQLDVGGFDTGQVTDMRGMFDSCENLTQLEVNGFDTSQVTDMGRMFGRCGNLTQLDVNGFDTGQVMNMQGMFGDCKSLTQLKVGSFDTGQVTNMGWMFYNCESLTQLEVSGFNTSRVTDMTQMFDGCSNLTQLEVGDFVTDQVTNMRHMFCGCESLTQLEVSGFDTSQVTDMENMFYECGNLTQLDLNGFDTGQVTNMCAMFSGCSSLTQLDVSGFDTGRVTNMGVMFYECKSLIQLDVSGFDTGQVTDMQWMFGNCGSLTQLEVGDFVTDQVTNMGCMFTGCKSLAQLDVGSFDTSQVTDMQWMFGNCESLTQLDVGGFDTGQVTDMGNMFYECGNLTQLDLNGFDTGQVTNMCAMFSGCSSLTQLDVSGFDTGRVTNMGVMFYECKNLIQLDVSGFDTGQVTDMQWMFGNCGSLTQLDVSGFDTGQVTSMQGMFDGCGVTAEEAGLKTE